MTQTLLSNIVSGAVTSFEVQAACIVRSPKAKVVQLDYEVVGPAIIICAQQHRA